MRTRRITYGLLWLTLPLAAALGVLAASAAAPHIGSSDKVFPYLAVGAAGCVALAVAVALVDPAWILSIGVALSVFSGNWTYMHVPGPLDRVVIFAGIAAVLIRSATVDGAPRVAVRRVHLLLAVLVLYAIGSSAWVNTLKQHNALFELLDRLGIVPFLLYLIAPATFATERQRTILLGVLSCVGAYLGLTAVFEMIGPHALVFPSYISNPLLGIHNGRARGPFLEAGADGLAMFACAVSALMLIARHPRPWLRRALCGVIALCLLGLVLTLTRQVWAGAVAGALLAALVDSRFRRLLPYAALVVAAIVVGALVLSPGLQTKLQSRAADQKPLWDRYNSDAAALRMIEARPALGFGWGMFPVASPAYYHVAKSYPLSSVPEVHNVILSNAVELGVIGAVVWLWALVTAIMQPLVRRGPPHLDHWCGAMVAIVVAWFVQANFTPLAYALDNYLPWLFAGVAFGVTRDGAVAAGDARTAAELAVRRLTHAVPGT